ncbi:NlpC/P60 family protein [Fodinisporobacter ferrooxydans]|uniref:NlpC/P60 family protein n=1 Tax=Fodinisporobacter ferrooxydans TaxID=2901836 RepID=A0ABY4CG26_9BACL|nr:NlpC/P60 family protein [Alicyclobacillaceae bacterium MYW30-H2]
MKLRRFISSSFIIGCTLFSTSVHADTIDQLQNSLNNANQQVQDGEQKQSQLQSQINDVQQSIHQVNQQMSINNQKLDSLTSRMNKVNQEMKDNVSKLHELQTIFDQQLKVMYENGTVDYLSVLLNSTSFSDFLSRFDALRLIANHNQDVMNQIKSLKLTLADQKKQVANDMQTIKQKQQELAVLQQTNETLQKQKQTQLVSVQSTIDSAKKNANYLQEQIAFAKREAKMSIQQPITETYPAGGSALASRGNSLLSGVSANQIVSIAGQYTGVPYAWGGTTPSGFDCSGYTQYVFSQAGVSLNRTSQGQFSQGMSVSRSELKPGDLVFFSTYGPGATHVGIYIGAGLFIDAEDSGVRVSSLSNTYWGPRYIGARRIVQ